MPTNYIYVIRYSGDGKRLRLFESFRAARLGSGIFGTVDLRDALYLAEWRREIADLYASVRRHEDPVAGWRIWREVRDRLFRSHPQSPIPQSLRESFQGLEYFDYDPSLRFAVELQPATPQKHNVSSSESESHTFTRFATASVYLAGAQVSWEVYWLEGYSGGLFLPFRDAGAGRSTYGGGRYVLDSAKGADLGMEGDRLIVDFNFAYQPSCAYDPRWVCPLAPEPNRLVVEIPAGERFAAH